MTSRIPTRFARSGAALLGAAAVGLVSACRPSPSPGRASRDTSRGSANAERDPLPRDVGRPATAEDLARWDDDILPDGSGLPPGRGTAAEGAVVFGRRCAACHGALGEGRSAPSLVGHRKLALGYRIGRPPPGEPFPTFVDFYPYATTLFDYVRRAMPWNAPGSLSDDDTYAVTAWMLSVNGLFDRARVLDRFSLPAVDMPARARFAYEDPGGEARAADRAGRHENAGAVSSARR